MRQDGALDGPALLQSMPAAATPPAASRPAVHFYLTQSVFKVVSQMSIPRQIRQLILYISNSKESVDESVEELTSAKRLPKRFM